MHSPNILVKIDFIYVRILVFDIKFYRSSTIMWELYFCREFYMHKNISVYSFDIFKCALQ